MDGNGQELKCFKYCNKALKVPFTIWSRHFSDYFNYSWKLAINSMHDVPVKNKSTFYWDRLLSTIKTHKNSHMVGRRQPPGSDCCCTPLCPCLIFGLLLTGWHLMRHCDCRSCRWPFRNCSFYSASAFSGSPHNPYYWECRAEEDRQQWSPECFLTLSFWPPGSQLPLLDHCPHSPGLPPPALLFLSLSDNFIGSTVSQKVQLALIQSTMICHISWFG